MPDEPKHVVFPDAGPLHAAAKLAVDSQLKKLEAAADVKEASGGVGVTKEAAILNAWSARESTAGFMSTASLIGTQIELMLLTMKAAIERIDNRLTLATLTLETSAEKVAAKLQTLSAQMEESGKAADKGARLLARWTKVLAVATLLLVAATAGLVVATWRLK